jgi:hypothetical protein
VPIISKSTSLNLLEPSGPVQARNGIALPLPIPLWGTRWCSWLRHCAISRKVAGLISDGVKSLNLLEPSGPVQACNGIALPLPIPLWSTRWCSWLRHCAISRKVAGLIPDGVRSLNLLERSWLLQACNRITLPFYTPLILILLTWKIG